MNFSNIFLVRENVRSFVYTSIYCVGAGISTLMSISNELGPYVFRRKMERTRPVKEEGMEGCLFLTRVGIFSFLVNMIKVPFPICTLTRRVNSYVPANEKVEIEELKVLLFL